MNSVKWMEWSVRVRVIDVEEEMEMERGVDGKCVMDGGMCG